MNCPVASKSVRKICGSRYIICNVCWQKTKKKNIVECYWDSCYLFSELCDDKQRDELFSTYAWARHHRQYLANDVQYTEISQINLHPSKKETLKVFHSVKLWSVAIQDLYASVLILSKIQWHFTMVNSLEWLIESIWTNLKAVMLFYAEQHLSLWLFRNSSSAWTGMLIFNQRRHAHSNQRDACPLRFLTQMDFECSFLINK